MSKTPVPFWVVIPYNAAQLRPGPTKTSHFLMLPNSTSPVRGDPSSTIVSAVGLPVFYSKPEAFEEARNMAMTSRSIPVVCELLAYVEIPQDIPVVTKFFNDMGETVTHDPKG